MATRPFNIMWFRTDCRLRDNPALTAAAADGDPVVPLFVASSNDRDDWSPSAVSRRRQQVSVARLAHDLDELGIRLVLRSGEPADVLARLTEAFPVKAVYWNRRYEPHERRVDDRVLASLRASGVAAHAFDGNLLFGPAEIWTSSGGPYRVFTPFWRACLERATMGLPEPSLKALVPPQRWPASDRKVTPAEDTFDFAENIARFLDGYAELRDRPDHDGTSRMSVRLHFGEVGPGEVWRAVMRYAEQSPETRTIPAQAFLRQIVWREFAHHLLYHFPDTTDAPMRPEFSRFPWRRDPGALKRWKLGKTGYPIVDAGMRELAHTGWVHNRARLVVSSFLVKHLLIDWREGARHFWETLEDADLANNTMGWQWVAGCGADAAPYFRIFNPVLQGEKFDPEGRYVRTWVPELTALPDRWIHQPWNAPAGVLSDAGVRLGGSYPRPIVDHQYARRRALAAYERTKKR